MNENIKRSFATGNHKAQKLYKYFGNIDYALSCLRSRKIHLEDPISYNDPFDTAVVIPHFGMEDGTFSLFDGKVRFSLYLGEIATHERSSYYEDMRQQLDQIDVDAYDTKKWNAAELINSIYDSFKTPCFTNKEFADEIDKGYRVMDGYCHIVSLVSCFNEEYDSIPMWSYYANQHKGVCIEFDLTRLDIDNELNSCFSSPELT